MKILMKRRKGVDVVTAMFSLFAVILFLVWFTVVLRILTGIDDTSKLDAVSGTATSLSYRILTAPCLIHEGPSPSEKYVFAKSKAGGGLDFFKGKSPPAPSPDCINADNLKYYMKVEAIDGAVWEIWNNEAAKNLPEGKKEPDPATGQTIRTRDFRRLYAVGVFDGVKIVAALATIKIEVS